MQATLVRWRSASYNRPHRINRKKLFILDNSGLLARVIVFAKLRIKNATPASGDARVIVCVLIVNRERIGT